LLELCYITVTNSQTPPYTIWSKLYNSSSNLSDSATAVCVDGNGNVFVTGWSMSPSTSQDIVTIKYDKMNGDTLWIKKFVSPLIDYPSAIAADNSFVYITGWTFPSSGNRDILTIKYNSATGDTVWVKRYNGTGNGGDYGLAIIVDGSGNVYITGRSDVGGPQKFTTIKYNAAGVQQWVSVYTGPLSSTFDEAHAIKLDGSGNVYVTGISKTSNTGDFLTLKMNSSGTVQWGMKYNGTSNGDDNAVDMELDASGSNLFVCGSSQAGSAGYDYYTIKYNTSNGDTLASARYNGPWGTNDVVVAMTKDESDNIYITGYSTGTSSAYNYATIKYNTSLTQQWLMRYAGPGGEDFAAGITYNSGFVYVTGASIGSGTGYDYLTLKYNANTGEQVWLARENGSTSGNDYASSIAVYDSTAVYVTGSLISGSPTGTDYCTLRYSQIPVGIRKISTNVPEGFSLKQNYPNPFNPVTNIKFEVPRTSVVKIFVYDLLGRETAVLVNQKLQPGIYETNWDASNRPSGVYFYKLITDSYSDTKKMILVK
jgi:hypothetical protein